jgi:Glycosyl hydrolase family 12
MKTVLLVGSLALLIACSSNGSGSGSGGTSGAAGASTGGASTGGASSGGSSTSGGSSATGGTSSSTGGASTGGTNAGGSGGTNAAGGTGATGGAGGSAGGGGNLTCTNPTHVLPLNQSNPQDGITLDGYYVDTDTWNAANYPVQQTMYVCNYNNWYVIANMNNDSGDGAVKTYPNVHKDFSNAPQISSFTTISSSFAHTAPSPKVGIYEFAYDIWLNGVASSGSTEVMIWTDNYNQVPSGSVQETVSLGGQSYKVYKSGSYIAFVDTTSVTSGTLDLLAFFNHIMGKGWIPSNSTLGAIDYGVELVSTNGQDATFQVNNFSVTTN